MDDMWARYGEARRSGTEALVKCRRQEMEVARLESEVASYRGALDDAASVRYSLERRDVERENEVARLWHQLSACEDTNRDLVVCTARLSESIFDLAGATDVESEAGRVRLRYDQLELRCAHLGRLLARANEEKTALERQVQQWAESHHQLRVQGAGLIADRDRSIKMLQAMIVDNGLHAPDVGH